MYKARCISIIAPVYQTCLYTMLHLLCPKSVVSRSINTESPSLNSLRLVVITAKLFNSSITVNHRQCAYVIVMDDFGDAWRIKYSSNIPAQIRMFNLITTATKWYSHAHLWFNKQDTSNVQYPKTTKFAISLLHLQSASQKLFVASITTLSRSDT